VISSLRKQYSAANPARDRTQSLTSRNRFPHDASSEDQSIGDATRVYRHGILVNFRKLERQTLQRCNVEMAGICGGERFWQSGDYLPAFRDWGSSRQRFWGAPFDHLLRKVRRGGRCREKELPGVSYPIALSLPARRISAGGGSRLCEHCLPAVWRAGAPGHRYDGRTFVDSFVVTSSATATRE